MHRLLLAPIVAALLLAPSCTKGTAEPDPEISEALDRLDETLNRSAVYVAEKEQRIASIRKKLSNTEPGLPQYRIYDALFDEYSLWNCDSALFYAHLKEILADRLNKPDLINDAAADIAFRYVFSGMYSSAMNITWRANERTGSFFTQDLPRLNLMYEIYHNMVLAFNDKYSQSEYVKQEAEYLQKIRDYENDDSPAYYNMLAKTMISEGNYGKLILILQERMDAGNLGTHEHAIFHYWIGKAYEISGDARNAFLHYITSAKADIESATREYHSLIRVSQFCLENGYTERAHRYIGRCQEDALIADAHTRLAQISSRLGSINKAYEKKTRDQNRSINIRNFFLRLVLGILILSLVYIVLSWRELKRTNKEIRGNIKAIQEANRIKEAYMGQFLSLASSHADALELYRSRLRTLAKRTDFEAIQQELRSDDFINEELANLYEIFDKTFLNLFPDFVEQLNELLRPEERVSLDLPGGKLTNELRVEALIKLGITDSRQIAKFLKLSLTTVFNYRVKFRNASLHERDSFEDHLTAIGR